MRACLISTSLCLLSPSVIAQPVPRPTPTSTVGFSDHGFGSSVAVLGNVDGVPGDDYVVGAPLESLGRGSVSLISGSSGSRIAHVTGTQLDARLGNSVARIGDQNGDGVDDCLVGEYWYDLGGNTNVGRVHVLSGADLTTIHVFNGLLADSWFGAAVASAGDTDGDTIDDILVGAPENPPPAADSGVAYLFSGSTWALRFPTPGQVGWSGGQGDWFGRAFGSGLDANGDGVLDVVIGVPGAVGPDLGEVRILSGSNGNELGRWTGPVDTTRAGESVAVIGDVDSDGVSDIVTGAPKNNGASSTIRGTAYVLSTQAILQGQPAIIFKLSDVTGDRGFGQGVAAVGDWNGDQVPDFGVTGVRCRSCLFGSASDGFLYVCSGATGRVLAAFESAAPGFASPPWLGEPDQPTNLSRVGFGDFGANGRPQVVIGSPDNNSCFVFDSGLIAGTPGSHSYFGSGCPCTIGSLDFTALTSQTFRYGETLTISASPVSSSGAGALLIGAEANLPLSPIGGAPCVLHVTPVWASFPATSLFSTFSASFAMPTNAASVGARFVLQMAAVPAAPAANPLGVCLSNAVEIEVGMP